MAVKTERLKKKAKDRIRVMADVVLANYEHFSMDQWAKTNCTTVGCIAGLVVVEFDKEEWDDHEAGLAALAKAGVREDGGENPTYQAMGSEIRDRAQMLLDITSAQGANIFYLSNWPSRFQQRFNKARTEQKKQANIASQYLTAIADGEVDINNWLGAKEIS